MTSLALLLIQLKMLLAAFAVRAHCWLVFKLSTRTPRSFSAELLPNSPQPGLLHRAIPSQRQDLAVALFGLQEAHISLFLQTVELPLNGSPALQLNSAFEMQ